MSKISFQPDLRPLLPTVFGPKDYHEFRDRLEQMEATSASPFRFLHRWYQYQKALG